MANVIKLKRGTSTPTTSDITNGEVALDTSAKKLFVNCLLYTSPSPRDNR